MRAGQDWRTVGVVPAGRWARAAYLLGAGEVDYSGSRVGPMRAPKLTCLCLARDHYSSSSKSQSSTLQTYGAGFGRV